MAAVSLTGAALLWPSLVTLPYEALVLYRILSWAGRRQSSHTAPIRLLQSYAGSQHLSQLYSMLHLQPRAEKHVSLTCLPAVPVPLQGEHLLSREFSSRASFVWKPGLNEKYAGDQLLFRVIAEKTCLL